MEGVTRLEFGIPVEQPPCPIKGQSVNGNYRAEQSTGQVADFTAFRPPPDCPIPVENLLQDLGINARFDVA